MKLAVSFIIALCANFAIGQTLIWKHVCRNNYCYKVELAGGEDGNSLAVCKLRCSDDGNLWPKPTGPVTVAKTITPFLLQNIAFNNANENAHTEWLNEIQGIFNDNLLKMNHNAVVSTKNGITAAADTRITVNTRITNLSQEIGLDTDESYTLATTFAEATNVVTVEIVAQTYFGARHGLETLSQLVAYDELNRCYQILNAVQISDKPVFSYRGVMLDTSRNFMPLPILRKVIDGMSYNKLNMFHIHLTDTHSYPLESVVRPKLTSYGAYSPRKTYSINDMQQLVLYAKKRGVKLVPEFDAPAHVGNGWQWGPSEDLGRLVVCENQEPWYDFCVQPPCGQLNLANDNIYVILDQVYKDYMSIFDKDLFHMGGDEVDFRCYNTSSVITDWMETKGIERNEEGFIKIWDEFQSRALGLATSITENANLTAVLWTSHLTNENYIQQYLNTETYVIQIWSGANDAIIPFLLDNGYRTIFSNYDTMYLDCGFQAWIGNGHNWCSPYKGWQTIYDNSPFDIYAATAGAIRAQEAIDTKQILGGETPLWSEQVDEAAVEGKLFPRVAALAERLWTDPRTTWFEAERRMVDNRQRLVERGIHSDGLQPEWCYQNENQCPGPPGPAEVTTTTAETETTTAETETTPGTGPNGATSVVLTPIYILLGLTPVIWCL